MLVVCRPALVALLQLHKATFNTYTLRLFKNDKVPADTDTVADYTEANFTGYAAIATNAWGNAFLNAGNIAEIDETNRTFTQTGVIVTNLVYGYYVTDGAGNLIFAERNPAGPFNMNANGLVYVVLPRYTYRNQPA